MKRTLLIRKVRRVSRQLGLHWRLVRQGREHELWACGPIIVAIPRHRELSPGVVDDIERKLEQALGEDWWK